MIIYGLQEAIIIPETEEQDAEAVWEVKNKMLDWGNISQLPDEFEKVAESPAWL
jgi:hypothetical protein